MDVSSSAHTSDMVREAAQFYRRRGYDVVGDSDLGSHPAFLGAMHPDLIVSRGDEHVAVAVRSEPDASRGSRWAEIARLVNGQPGWRFDVYIAGPAGTSPDELLSSDAIEARLRQGVRLARAGHLDASLLVTWAAAEATLRHLATSAGLPLDSAPASALLYRLFSEGLLDRRSYDMLARLSVLRNRVAHGYQASSLTADSLTELRRVVRLALREAASMGIPLAT